MVSLKSLFVQLFLLCSWMAIIAKTEPRKYPTLLCIHDTPLSHDLPGILANIQWPYIDHVQWFCGILKRAADLGFSCNDSPPMPACPPLFHNILELPQPNAAPAVLRAHRDMVIQKLNDEMDAKRLHGATLSDADMKSADERADIVKAAAGVLLGADAESRKRHSLFMENAWNAYEKEVVSRLPGNILWRLIHQILEHLHSYFPRLYSPMSNKRILDTVCYSRTRNRDEL
jgi:hypothetical protein